MKTELTIGEALATYGTELHGFDICAILVELIPMKESVLIALKDNFGKELKALQYTSILQLMKLGCTKSQSNKIMALAAIAKRWNNIGLEKSQSVSSAADVLAIFQQYYKGKEQEEFWVIHLNTKNHMISKHLVTKGLVDRSLVHPREVFRTAIKEGCNRIILVHNHPSGDPTPSEHDIQSTRMLLEASRIVGIEIIDHIVVGFQRADSLREYVSFRELGLMKMDL